MWTWSSQPTSNFCFGSTATDHTALVAGTAITADQLLDSLQRLVAPLQTLKMCSPEITNASRLCASSHCHVSVWAWCLVQGQLANCFRQGCCGLLCGDGIQGDRGRFHDPIASQDCCVPQHPQSWMEKQLQYTKDPTAISTTAIIHKDWRNIVRNVHTVPGAIRGSSRQQPLDDEGVPSLQDQKVQTAPRKLGPSCHPTESQQSFHI